MSDRTTMTGEWLAHCGACPVPEIANVFRRAGVDFHQVTGMLDNDPAAGTRSTRGSTPPASPTSCCTTVSV